MTVIWNEVTIWWNEVTKGWNEVAWNEVVVERSDRNSAGGGGVDHPFPLLIIFSVACALRKECTATQEAILLWVVVQGFHYEEAMHDNLSPFATVIVNATKLIGTGRFVGHTYQFVLSCGKPKRGRI